MILIMVLACGDFPASFVSFYRPPISVRQPGPGPGVVNSYPYSRYNRISNIRQRLKFKPSVWLSSELLY